MTKQYETHLMELCTKCKLHEVAICTGTYAILGSTLLGCKGYISTVSSVIIDDKTFIPHPIKKVERRMKKVERKSKS
jgi:hypothetical protein